MTTIFYTGSGTWVAGLTGSIAAHAIGAGGGGGPYKAGGGGEHRENSSMSVTSGNSYTVHVAARSGADASGSYSFFGSISTLKANGGIGNTFSGAGGSGGVGAIGHNGGGGASGYGAGGAGGPSGIGGSGHATGTGAGLGDTPSAASTGGYKAGGQTGGAGSSFGAGKGAGGGGAGAVGAVAGSGGKYGGGGGGQSHTGGSTYGAQGLVVLSYSSSIGISVSEAGIGANTIAETMTASVAVSEAAIGADTVAEQMSAAIAATETATGADAVAVQATVAIAISETGSAADTVAAGMTAAIAASESGVAADSFSATGGVTPPVVVAPSGGFDAGPSAFGGWFNLAFKSGQSRRRKRATDIGRELDALAYAEEAHVSRATLAPGVAKRTDEVVEQAVAALRRDAGVADDAAALRRVAAHEIAFARLREQQREDARRAFIAAIVERATREYIQEAAEHRRRRVARDDADILMLMELV